MNLWSKKLSFGILVLFIMTVDARGETLEEAMVAAYLNNPTLLGVRASLRSTDEQVPAALSGWRPTVMVSGKLGRVKVSTGNTSASNTSKSFRKPKSIALSVTQRLYNGGESVAAVKRAENMVLADRARLVETEQAVLLRVATVYMNVLRDQQVHNLAINNERRLERQLQAARDRFKVGEVTGTGVAQAEARVSSAVAERVLRKSNLISSQASYLNVVGSLPENLIPTPPLSGQPESEFISREIATEESPAILRALYIERAARADIDIRMAALLPVVELRGTISRDYDSFARGSRITRKEITANLTIPLYQSGLRYSNVRAAREIASQRRVEVEKNRRSALENVTRSWEKLLAAQAQVLAFKDSLRATKIALNGVEEEAAVGLRTTLDVLDAEQELFSVQVKLVRAERDHVVASYSLRAAIGRLSAKDLGLDVDIYDVTRHYNAVRNKFWGYEKVE